MRRTWRPLCWIPNDWRRPRTCNGFHHETENLSGALANYSWSYIVEPGTSSTELTRRENALHSSEVDTDSQIRCSAFLDSVPAERLDTVSKGIDLFGMHMRVRRLFHVHVWLCAASLRPHTTRVSS